MLSSISRHFLEIKYIADHTNGICSIFLRKSIKNGMDSIFIAIIGFREYTFLKEGVLL